MFSKLLRRGSYVFNLEENLVQINLKQTHSFHLLCHARNARRTFVQRIRAATYTSPTFQSWFLADWFDSGRIHWCDVASRDSCWNPFWTFRGKTALGAWDYWIRNRFLRSILYRRLLRSFAGVVCCWLWSRFPTLFVFIPNQQIFWRAWTSHRTRDLQRKRGYR